MGSQNFSDNGGGRNSENLLGLNQQIIKEEMTPNFNLSNSLPTLTDSTLPTGPLPNANVFNSLDYLTNNTTLDGLLSQNTLQSLSSMPGLIPTNSMQNTGALNALYSSLNPYNGLDWSKFPLNNGNLFGKNLSRF